MMRFCFSLYLIIAAVYLLSASGRIGLSDGFAMFNVAESIVNQRSLSAEPCDPQLPGHPNHCVPGVDGRYYAGFGLVPSLLAVPAVICADRIAALGHIRALAVSKVMVSVFTALVSPLACVVLAMWIVKLGYSHRTAMWGAFILAFASPFWQFGAKGFFSEPYTTLALLLAAYLLTGPETPRAAGLSGLAFGVACGCRINSVILFPAFLLTLALQLRAGGWTATQFLRRAGLFTASFSVCAFLIGLANYIRFGSPLKTGYHLVYPSASQLFSTPLFTGMFELLFSGEVGLLIFAPWVLVALICFPSFVRAHLPESVLCGTMFLFNFLFFAKYAEWHAGWVAGPRFLTPTLPFLILAMVACIEGRLYRGVSKHGPHFRIALRTVMLILVIGAALIQCVAAVYPPDRYYNLVTFYGVKQTKPWWMGSIPLASIDFLSRVASANVQAVGPREETNRDQLSVAHEQAQAWPVMGTATTEDAFLRSFPNSENLVLPNLMLFKMKLLGLPSAAVYGYSVVVLFVGGVGLVSLKRCATPGREK